MGKKRFYIPSKKRTKNLEQYQGMSEEEFDEMWDSEYGENTEEDDSEILAELKARTQEKLDELEKDYDFSDMKANDRMQLESLILAMLQLDDIEKEVYKRRNDLSDTNILALEKFNKILSQLRADISTISTDLQLTKKIRNKSKDISIVQRWEELSKKASQFYEQKMLYIFCPDCRTLLSNVWLLYPREEKNKITLYCKRCNTKHDILLSELYETGNKNLPDVIV
jgi:RNase P subunit RPR2